MAEFRSNHDWNFTNAHFFVIIKDGFLLHRRSRPVIACLIAQNLPYDLDGNVDLCLVSETTQTRLMRQQLYVVLFTAVPWKLVNSDVSKCDFVVGHFVPFAVVLFGAQNVGLPELFDDLLDVVLKETFVRVNLLRNETVLLEV